MHFLRSNIGLGLAGLLYILFSAYFIWFDQAYFALLSIGLLFIYFAVYYSEYSFLALAFLTPLSINIEEYTNSLGLFVPTEPLLFGMMLLLIMQETRKGFIPKHVWRSPILIAAAVYVT